jgi:hypothetical protein
MGVGSKNQIAMRIHDKLHIRDIQVGFNQLFPHLKLSFYKTEHHAGEGTPRQAELNAELTLEQARTVHSEGELVIDPYMTVAELEEEFARHFGLNAQVFRKSGNLWMQTTATDNWTLGEQNRKGESSEAHFAEKYGDDLQEEPG